MRAAVGGQLAGGAGVAVQAAGAGVGTAGVAASAGRVGGSVLGVRPAGWGADSDGLKHNR